MSSLGVEQPNQNYLQACKYVKLMRDCVTGEPALKAPQNQQIYLPSPACADADKEETIAQYKRYIIGAEYDNVPSTTLDALQGALNHQPNNYDDIAPEMRYLIEDADGDGLSLDEHVKIAQSELLQMKFCGLLAEYSDLASLGVGDEQLTVAQVQELGLRSSVKLYPRESILNWDFKRINGVKQLAWIILCESETEQDIDSFTSQEVKSYLLLALDEDGKYYQRRYVESQLNGSGWSEPFYPEHAGGMFDFIPFEFAMQGNYPKGVIPDALGYLFPIATKSLQRYRLSADYDEVCRFTGIPITTTSGWTEHTYETFKNINGRDSLLAVPGAHWALPEGVTADIIQTDVKKDSYESRLDRNAREIQALGGSFDMQESGEEMTATAKVINAAEKLSVLSSLQSGLERSYQRVISYCAMFEGVNAESLITLNREFMSVKLTPQDRRAITDELNAGQYDEETARKLLEKGGVLDAGEAEAITTRMQLSGKE